MALAVVHFQVGNVTESILMVSAMELVAPDYSELGLYYGFYLLPVLFDRVGLAVSCN